MPFGIPRSRGGCRAQSLRLDSQCERKCRVVVHDRAGLQNQGLRDRLVTLPLGFVPLSFRLLSLRLRLCCLHQRGDTRHDGQHGEDGENGDGGTAQPALPTLLAEVLTCELGFLLSLDGRGQIGDALPEPRRPRIPRAIPADVHVEGLRRKDPGPGQQLGRCG